MAKTDPDELSRLVTSELTTYLGAGELNANRLAESIDYSGLRITDLDQLKQLHFALYSEVVDYVDRLQERLRRVKIEHRRQQESTHGEVRGPIKWQETLRKRPKTGDPALFVISNPEIELDIPENRVVKKLVSTIAEPLTKDIEGTDQDWRDMWQDTDIVELQRTLEHNVYLDQLPDAREIQVTDRDLSKARRSRHRLYSKGAELYRLYDDLLNDRYQRDEVQSLLRETIVTPSKDPDLFELFCLFAEIHRLKEEYPELELKRIEPGMDEIASLNGKDRKISIYYDQGGPLKFFEDLPTSDELKREWRVPKAIVRHQSALEQHESLVESFLKEGKNHSYYQGRPDLVITEYAKQGGHIYLDRVSLGEVKYSRSTSTFSSGLRELLEYIYIAREKRNQDYIFGEQLSTEDVQGIIFTDGVSTETDTSDIIDHKMTADILEFLE